MHWNRPASPFRPRHKLSKKRGPWVWRGREISKSLPQPLYLWDASWKIVQAHCEPDSWSRVFRVSECPSRPLLWGCSGSVNSVTWRQRAAKQPQSENTVPLRTGRWTLSYTGRCYSSRYRKMAEEVGVGSFAQRKKAQPGTPADTSTSPVSFGCCEHLIWWHHLPAIICSFAWKPRGGKHPVLSNLPPSRTAGYLSGVFPVNFFWVFLNTWFDDGLLPTYLTLLILFLWL